MQTPAQARLNASVSLLFLQAIQAAAQNELVDVDRCPPEPAKGPSKGTSFCSVGWDLPHWRTSTSWYNEASVGSGIWYKVLKHLEQDDLSRIALRDSCTAFRHLYYEHNANTLRLEDVCFDARTPTRIFCRDFLAEATPESSRGKMTAKCVFKEVSKFGRERSKVVHTGVFFPLATPEGFKIPPYILLSTWVGSANDDLSRARCGVRTPNGLELVESLDYITDPSEYIAATSAQFYRTISGESPHQALLLERWTSTRNVKSNLFATAFEARKRHLIQEMSSRGIRVKSSDGSISYPRGLPRIRFARAEPRGPDDWQREVLDGEGLDDTFTLQDIAHIVTGRFKSPSGAFKGWSHDFASVSTSWRTEGGPLLVRLTPSWDRTLWVMANASG